MDDKIRNLLDEEIERVLRVIGASVPGGDEYNDAISCLDRLYKLRLEEAKTDKEYAEKLAKRLSDDKQRDEEFKLKAKQIDEDARLKEKQIDEDVRVKLEQIRNDSSIREAENALKKNQITKEQFVQYLKAALEAAGIVLPLAFYAVWMYCGFKFEETGTIVSPVFKGLIQKFKPTRK